MPNAEPEDQEVGDHLIHASGKFIVLEKLVTELVIRRKEKVLFFSGFTRMLDICEDVLNMMSDYGSVFQFARLDGDTCRARRNLGIRLFSTKPGTCPLITFGKPYLLTCI